LTEPRRILVVDDEELARRRVARMVREAGGDFVIEEADSGVAAVEAIRAFAPDVVFLDVEMPGMTGFEVLRQFEERPFKVIFETAYDEFAVAAFEEQACDYLLKPFTSERLRRALERALERAADEARLRALEARLVERDGWLRRLAVRQGGRLRVATEAEIDCFVSRDHVTCVYFGDGREATCDLSLAGLEARLDPGVFTRLHRSTIVRATAVLALARDRDGGAYVELANGMRLPVARSRRAAAKALLRG
jgi:two-component system LytT family response regulator